MRNKDDEIRLCDENRCERISIVVVKAQQKNVTLKLEVSKLVALPSTVSVGGCGKAQTTIFTTLKVRRRDRGLLGIKVRAVTTIQVRTLPSVCHFEQVLGSRRGLKRNSNWPYKEKADSTCLHCSCLTSRSISLNLCPYFFSIVLIIKPYLEWERPQSFETRVILQFKTPKLDFLVAMVLCRRSTI